MRFNCPVNRVNPSTFPVAPSILLTVLRAGINRKKICRKYRSGRCFWSPAAANSGKRNAHGDQISLAVRRHCARRNRCCISGARHLAVQGRFVGQHCVGDRNSDTCCRIRTLSGRPVDRKTNSPKRARRSLSAGKYFRHRRRLAVVSRSIPDGAVARQEH